MVYIDTIYNIVGFFISYIKSVLLNTDPERIVVPSSPKIHPWFAIWLNFITLNPVTNT